MRVALTKYGWPQVVVWPLVIVAAMAAYVLIALHLPGRAIRMPWAILTFWLVEFALLAALIWTLSFFRDPPRTVPQDDALLVAPADGKVTDVETVDDCEYISGPALRIGIFLSIFDVHLNRAPCNATVEKIAYRQGKYLNALNPLSGKVNESNAVTLVRTGQPNDRLVVRQVSGAIARRIVCAAGPGQVLDQGEKFGMIKFGSRTELYVPAGENVACLVHIGDKVKAGVTGLVRYEPCRD